MKAPRYRTPRPEKALHADLIISTFDLEALP